MAKAKKLDQDTIDQIKELRQAGHSVQETAEQLGLSLGTISKYGGGKADTGEKVKVFPPASKVPLDDGTIEKQNELRRRKLEVEDLKVRAENIRARVELADLEERERERQRQAQHQPESFEDTILKLASYRKFFDGQNTSPAWASDPLKFIQAIQTISGSGDGDEGLKKELSELRQALGDMQTAQTRQQLEGYQQQVLSLSKKIEDLTDYVTDLRRPMTGMTEIGLLHELGTKGIDELSALRLDAKGLIKEAIAGGRLPPIKTPEERERQKNRLRKATREDIELQMLGESIFGRSAGQPPVLNPPPPKPAQPPITIYE